MISFFGMGELAFLSSLALFAASCVSSGDSFTAGDDAGHGVEADTDLPSDSSAPDGGDGTQVDCDAVAFCPEDAPVDPRHSLHAIWGTAMDDIWTVGSAGTILHFDGAAWVALPPVTDRTLFAVGGTGKDDVWIASTTSSIFHGHGFVNGQTTWASVAMQPFDYEEGVLYTLWARSPGDVWVGGKCFEPDGLTLATRWRSRADASDAGVQWTTSGACSSRTHVITTMWGTGTSVWAAGTRGKVFRTTASTIEDDAIPEWTEFDSLSLHELRGIWGSGDDVWIVGGGGAIRHFTGSPFLEFVASPTGHDLNGVWGAAPDDIWAVGESGTILHYDGSQWQLSTAIFPHGIPHLYGVWGSGPEDVWAVGEGVILRLVKPGSGPQGGIR